MDHVEKYRMGNSRISDIEEAEMTHPRRRMRGVLGEPMPEPLWDKMSALGVFEAKRRPAWMGGLGLAAQVLIDALVCVAVIAALMALIFFPDLVTWMLSK